MQDRSVIGVPDVLGIALPVVRQDQGVAALHAAFKGNTDQLAAMVIGPAVIDAGKYPRVAVPFQADQVVADVLHGCRLAAHHAAQNVDDFARFVARYYGASETATRHAVDRELPRYQLDCKLDMTGLQNSVDMLHELGGIPRAMKAREFTDLRFQADLIKNPTKKENDANHPC